jgi:hypothetical protein
MIEIIAPTQTEALGSRYRCKSPLGTEIAQEQVYDHGRRALGGHHRKRPIPRAMSEMYPARSRRWRAAFAPELSRGQDVNGGKCFSFAIDHDGPVTAIAD